jgi:phthalate 4,5-dioxygenase reductase subunit
MRPRGAFPGHSVFVRALSIITGGMPSSADTPFTVRIARKTEIATDIFAFELRAPDGGDLPAFTPGAHVTVTTPTGLQRKFSLCNAPAERSHYQIAVKREGDRRGGSMSLIDEAAVGDTLKVTAPRNDFSLRSSQAGYVFIAGGIGIAPILSMLRHLEQTGSARYKLYYCTRSPDQTAFRDELGTAALRGKVVMHHDDGEPGRMFDFWPVLETPAGRQLYCCGPRPLMREVQDMTGHWPSSAVHFEPSRSRPSASPTTGPSRSGLPARVT